MVSIFNWLMILLSSVLMNILVSNLSKASENVLCTHQYLKEDHEISSWKIHSQENLEMLRKHLNSLLPVVMLSR